MSTKTRPIGPGTSNVTINMPISLKQALKRQAGLSDMKVGAYCRRILEDAAKQKVRFILSVAQSAEL